MRSITPSDLDEDRRSKEALTCRGGGVDRQQVCDEEEWVIRAERCEEKLKICFPFIVYHHLDTPTVCMSVCVFVCVNTSFTSD